jgi:hypothetical protein
MRGYVNVLGDYRQEFGVFPSSLSDLDLPSWIWATENNRDMWGHPLHYESTPAAFILVSFGRDGVPDGLDYWAMQASKVEPGKTCWWATVLRAGEPVKKEQHCFEWDEDHVFSEDICYAWNADQVFSNRGEHRACGK